MIVCHPLFIILCFWLILEYFDSGIMIWLHLVYADESFFLLIRSDSLVGMKAVVCQEFDVFFVDSIWQFGRHEGSCMSGVWCFLLLCCLVLTLIATHWTHVIALLFTLTTMTSAYFSWDCNKLQENRLIFHRMNGLESIWSTNWFQVVLTIFLGMDFNRLKV